jgi:hypothetical protein
VDLRLVPIVTGTVFTVAQLMYYGPLELREMTLNLMIALCTGPAEKLFRKQQLQGSTTGRDESVETGADDGPSVPLSWSAITQWWLPLANPLTGVKEERLRVPACRLCELLARSLAAIGPPAQVSRSSIPSSGEAPESESSSAAGASRSTFSFPSHLACISAYEAMLQSRPTYTREHQGGAVNLQTLFANHLQKSMLGPLYADLRRSLPHANNNGVDEATKAVLALRAKDTGDAWAREANNGPLKLASDTGAGCDSVLLPPPFT